LPLNLRPNGDHQNLALPQLTVKIAPRLEFRHAIRTPAPPKELDDEWTQRQQIRGAHKLAIGILQRKLWSHCPDGKDAFFHPCGKQLFNRALAHSQPLGLH
jgi:hypothetical protein